jgi:hypothetical protein
VKTVDAADEKRQTLYAWCSPRGSMRRRAASVTVWAFVLALDVQLVL